ncbi:MAG: hypothetical protein ACXVBW_14210 [Bdellovibrionota bacterium]
MKNRPRILFLLFFALGDPTAWAVAPYVSPCEKDEKQYDAARIPLEKCLDSETSVESNDKNKPKGQEAGQLSCSGLLRIFNQRSAELRACQSRQRERFEKSASN